MSHSEQINELALALSVAQGSIQNAAKDSSNPFFNSSYADLASIRDAIREAFSVNGLAVIQLPSAEGPKVTITTILAHKSGQWVSSDLTMTADKSTPQAIGSAITYARRYALAAVAGVAPEDDDGEAALDRKKAAKDVGDKKLADMKLADMKSRQDLNEDIKANPPKAGKKSTTPFDVMKYFGELKKRYHKIGMDDFYYQKLGEYGVAHCNEFPNTPEGIQQARDCFKAMQLDVANCEAAAAKDAEAAQ